LAAEGVVPEPVLERLNAHRDWANGILLDWQASLAEPEPYCHKMLSHILLAEEVWLGRILDKPHRSPWAALLPSAEMETMRAAHRAGWEGVLAGAAGPLARVFAYRRYTGAEAASSIADALTHVCAHGAYHRGQIAAQAARAGLKVPSTDFILFADLG
jgi:uncharacterized damage-inducible protein DinB